MANPIQSAHGQGSGDFITVSFASLPTVGNYVIVVAATDGNSIATDAITDNQGNTYTQDASAPGSSAECAIHRSKITASAGTFTVKLNPVGTAAFQDLAIMEYAASAFDSTALVNKTFIGTETTTATPTTASGATTAQCTIIGGVTHSGGTQTITPGATYTQILEDENATNMPINVESKSVAAGTYTADWTLASATNSQTVAVAYKEASAAAGVTYPELERGTRGIMRGLLAQ